MKLISVVTPCFNEEENLEELYLRIKAVFEKLDGYDYEHIFADNASTGNTVKILSRLVSKIKYATFQLLDDEAVLKAAGY